MQAIAIGLCGVKPHVVNDARLLLARHFVKFVVHKIPFVVKKLLA